MKTIDLILSNGHNERIGDRNYLLGYLREVRKPENFSPVSFCFNVIEWQLRFNSSGKLVLSVSGNDFTTLDFSELTFNDLVDVTRYVRHYEIEFDKRTEDRDLVTLLEILCDYIKEPEKNEIRGFTGLCLLLYDLSDDFISQSEKEKINSFLSLMWENRADQSLTLDSMSGFMFPLGDIEKRVEFLETCIALLRVLEMKNLQVTFNEQQQ